MVLIETAVQRWKERSEDDLATIIRNYSTNIKMRHKSGDYSELLVWVIKDVLACSQRPLRFHREFGRSRQSFPLEAKPAVIEWIERIKQEGIRSIIVLTAEEELRYYDPLDLHANGLLGYYHSEGLIISPIPWPDPAHVKQNYPAILHEIRRIALPEYNRLPKPVLIHCSAAIDRSPPVAAYIVRMTYDPD